MVEAFDQGALQTQLDLAILLGVCDAVVSQFVNEIQSEGKLLQTRGNIHDLSGAITHKREIITLYLGGYFTPEIAMKTKHSNEASTATFAIISAWKYSGSTVEQTLTKFHNW